MSRSTPRSIFRNGLWLALAAMLLAVTVVSAAPPAQGGGKLSKHDRELLLEAQARGDTTVVLLIAARPGANGAVARSVESLGGVVRYRDDGLDYLRAVVAIDKAEAVAALGGIVAVNLNELIPLEDPHPAGTVPPTPQTPPGASTPLVNPYMPIGDTGAAQFVQAHPAWDGRGVTVGLLDTGVDLNHPSLQTTSTGQRKIVDWVTFTDPLSDGDPTWINMGTQVNVVGGSFTVGSNSYTGVAADGTYRFGVFSEAALGATSEYGPPYGATCNGADVNRNGVCNEVFAVLWRTSDNKVWVDANADKSFAGEMAMTDYKLNYDVNYFGTDNLATAVREAVPFVVQTDGKDKFVNIGIVAGAHGSHVAGIIGGNAFFGGAMTGAAPGAKLVSVRVCLFVAGCTSHALIEGMIYAAKQSNADVINMSIGGLPSLNDGNNSRAILYNRLIEQSNVQMFISAGNSGAGVNTVGDPSVASLVMSVGSYISKDTWQKNYGSDSTLTDNMHPFSSRGPAENGAFKPNIIAPGSAISSVPTWQLGQPVNGTYNLPPGYGMFNGTSMAAPQATGAGALLVSAAKQAGAQHQPAQLRQAMNSSARFIANYQAFEQGNGLINVGAAWDLLKTNIKLSDITSAVEVNTVLSGFLVPPGIGVGIYDREGVSAGNSYVRTYTFTRTKGGKAPAAYNVSWVGNDGTFSSAASIALPLNTPVTFPVTVHPAATGAHSAILNLDDPGTAGIDYQTMNMVIAADQFTAGNNYTVVTSGTIGRNQSKSFFFKVPANTPAFKVDFVGPSTVAGTGQARFLRFHPYGVGIDSNSSTSCYSPSAGVCSGSPLSRTTSNPQPGVWEVTVEARRTSDVDNAPFTLTASILGASVSPNPDTIASATIGVPVARSYTLTNMFGAFTGRAVGTTFGSAYMATPSIDNHQQQWYTVTVTAGTTSLRATIGSASDPAADLDLFAYDCTGTSCVLAKSSAGGSAEESVTISSPAAGLWKVLIDGYSVPAGTTMYNYLDVFTNTAFGSVSVTDANALRPSGASWTVPGSVTVNAAPAAGRVLLGAVQVRTDSNVLVGSGDVIVQSVLP